MFRQTGVNIELVKNDAWASLMPKCLPVDRTSATPVFANTRSHAVLTTLMSRKRGKGRAIRCKAVATGDPKNRRGTLLWTVTQDRTITGSTGGIRRGRRAATCRDAPDLWLHGARA